MTIDDMERRGAIARAVTVALAMLAVGCEPPAGSATPVPAATASLAPAPTDAPRRPPTPTPPNGPDAYACTEPVALPPIADVIGVAWSPNGRTLAIDRMVVLPNDQITGSPEEFFL